MVELTLKYILAESVRHYTTDKRLGENLSYEVLTQIIQEQHLDLAQILARATLIANKNLVRCTNRNSITYHISARPQEALCYTTESSVSWHIDPETIKKCIISTNDVIELIHNLTFLYDVNIFETLGMRNLSSFVGELFGHEVGKAYHDKLVKNPNQDGYPDLCALTPEGKEYIKKNLQSNGQPLPNKEFWSPYPFGGIEVKATCGNTPDAETHPKPLIGESRLPIMISAEWKAHHQQTKMLLCILWDFIDGIPIILAAFFRNDLDISLGKDNRDWAPTVTPKGASRTTSVSIMRRGGRDKKDGVKKMGAGWLVLPEPKKLHDPICKIFDIKLDQ